MTTLLSLAASGGEGSASFTGQWAVFGMGANCTLPVDVTINQTLIEYVDDVGTPA